MIELDEELANALAERLADGVPMAQLETEQAGVGFTFMVYVEGSTRWFPHKVSNRRAHNWPQVREQALAIYRKRVAGEVTDHAQANS